MKPDRRTSRRSRQMGVSAFPDAAHGSGNGCAFSAAGSSGIAHRTQENETVLRRAARPENDACEAEWKYRSIFDEALEGIFQTTIEGLPVLANPAAARMLGYNSADELLGTVMNVGVDVWAHLSERAELLNRLEQEGAVRGFECRLRHKDGGEFWASLSARYACDANGNTRYIQGFIEDITSRRDVERQLRMSEARFRTSFEQAAVGIAHTSADGKILRCNRRFAGIVGYTPDELIGLTFQQITPPGDRPGGDKMRERLLSGEINNASFEKRYMRKDGSLTWVALTIALQRGGESDPQHFITMVQDINARKQAEEELEAAQKALRASEERYRIAFQTTLDAVNINRLSDGLYIECNKSFLDITGHSYEEVIGRTSLELSIWANPDDRERMVDCIRKEGICRSLETQFRKKNGDVFWGLMYASKIELDGVSCVLSITRDLSDAKLAEEKINNLAFYDPLTGLPNRRLLMERLQQSLAKGIRNAHSRAVLFIDLDNFKTLNDSLGHQVGDLLLREIAQRIKACKRENDVVARLGGDEFAVLLDDLSPIPADAVAQAELVAERILAATSLPIFLANHECLSSTSLGIALIGKGRKSPAEVLKQAEIAMYQAKGAGRGTLRFFAPQLQTAVNARAALEEELRRGIKANQFQLWYQPQVDRRRLVGAEALLRWRHPNRGILAPSEFISLAEESGLILPLGDWVLEEACKQINRWGKRKDLASIAVAVNISAVQFRKPEFVERVLSIIDASGADPTKIQLEITESMLVENLEDLIVKMNVLKARGVSFALDDFGTGYSSLSYLKRLPLDQLKIDRSFVRDIGSDVASGAIARALITLGQVMGLSVIAEGIETEEQREFLTRLGCHTFQGFLFSHPVPAEEFETFRMGRADQRVRSSSKANSFEGVVRN